MANPTLGSTVLNLWLNREEVDGGFAHCILELENEYAIGKRNLLLISRDPAKNVPINAPLIDHQHLDKKIE